MPDQGLALPHDWIKAAAPAIDRGAHREDKSVDRVDQKLRTHGEIDKGLLLNTHCGGATEVAHEVRTPPSQGLAQTGSAINHAAAEILDGTLERPEIVTRPWSYPGSTSLP